MWKNHFKIAWRNLLKDRGNTLINVGGLAVGLVCCIAIALYVWDEYSFDRFHRNFGRIYRVIEHQVQGGERYDVAVSPGPLAPALKSSFAEVEQTCRIGRTWQPMILKAGDQSLETPDILITDNSFFSLFDFHLVRGDTKTVLEGADEVVITERFAEKLFGPNWQSESLIGEQITYNRDRQLVLAGIVADPPSNSHIQFDILLAVKSEERNTDNFSWESNNYHTYLALDERADVPGFGEKIEGFLSNYSTDTTSTLALQPLAETHLYSDFDFQTDWSKSGDIAYIRIFISVGIVVILIAIFNFINLSTASATNRIKEVGVRKVMGALPRQLVIQFLTEAFLVSLFAMVLAVLLLQLFLPVVNGLPGKTLVLPFDSVRFVSLLFGSACLLSLLAGIYPAVFLSRFKNVKNPLAGNVALSGQRFRQFLIVAQFTFAIILMVSTVTIYRQLNFLQQRDLGFDRSHLVSVFLKNDLRAKSELFKDDLKAQSSISQVTLASGSLINMTSSTDHIDWEGNGAASKLLMSHMNVDPDFLTTTGMKLLAGRNFDPSLASDSTSFVINETAVREMGWNVEEAVGKTIDFWDQPGVVIGVVKDFNFRPMTVAIEPMLLRCWPNFTKSNLLVRITPGQVSEGLEALEKAYKKYEKEAEFQFSFVDQALDAQYRADQNAGKIVLTFAALAISIACFGLIGLAAYSTGKRTKEIGVRKVLGASFPSILVLLSREFLLLLFIAFVVACPIAFWIGNGWLGDYAFRIEIKWWFFAGAGGLATTVAMLTVSFQSIKAALMNPVKSLRSE